MEKNVGGIDLEELRKAREELMQERAETGEAPVSAFEPVQESASETVEPDYAQPQSSSVIDNPNVSRVFEREAPKQPEPQPEEEDDFDIDALVNEVFNGEYESKLDEESNASEDAEIDIDAMIGDNSNDIIDELSKNISLDEEPQTESQVSEPQVLEMNETVEAAPAVPESNSSEARDFSVYDSFAAFEVNAGAEPAVEPAAEPEISNDLSKFEVEEQPEDVSAKLDALMDTLSAEELTSETQEETTDENVVEEPQQAESLEEPVENVVLQNETVEEASSQDAFSAFERFAVKSEEEPQTIPAVQEYAESEDGSLSSLGSFDFDKPKTEEPIQEESVEAESEQEVEEVSTENDIVLENGISVEDETSESAESAESDTEQEDTMSMVSSLSDLEKMMREDEERAAQLDEEIQKLEQQVQTGDFEEPEQAEEQPETVSAYPKIEPYNFVDVISTDEFKDSDKLTYVVGKDEQGAMHYGNLRDNYNVVVFGKENEYTNNYVHSMLLSLILKNTVNEVNFVICDSKADSKFEVYNKSSYMYFNRIAKTNKEILDILIELNKELEERYKLLAEIGVKSIEQYNIIAKNDNLKPLPYIVTVFNNYSKAIQLTESDKINTCLYQILKFGRIAGMYIILVANNTIMSNEINYNLPTRISFKCEDSEMSLTTLGEDGAESLSNDGDFLFSTVGADGLVHMKVASLTSNEIELLVENIED